MTDPVAIINSSLDAPAVVATVRVHGLRLVKDDVLQPHLRAAMTATTLGGVLRGLSDASERIQRLDVFHDFDVRVGEPRDDLAPENALDVDIYVREKGRLKAETGTSVGMGTGEGSLRLSAGVRHVFGRAERLDVQAAAGTSANASFALTFTKPVEADPDRPLELSLFHQQNDWKLPSGYEEKAVGLLAKYRAPSLLGVHVVSYEASWRELTHLSRYVSWAVREEAGHSLKSALRHELLHNRSDSLVMPTQGYQVRLTQELAGIGGDVNYLKHDLHTKAAVRLGWGISTSLGLQFGVMAPLADTPTRINDRFFLGGPVSLRGFRLRAAGPSAPRSCNAFSRVPLLTPTRAHAQATWITSRRLATHTTHSAASCTGRRG
eukprot:Unigene8571_Nuclearia_a/m.26250 Unigene8571_Nuclearia_a/g.26250  ORF Unigene8571_Nuclearia_a/g.26250 Unigene8571_Nuclearia_a/m.26250 type:complete len:378 (+) Unigene8571_Nuclearia_a:39-1172(+)